MTVEDPRPPLWVGVEVASRLLGCSPRHVRRLILAGDIEGMNLAPSGARRKRWAVRRGSVIDFQFRRRLPSKF